MSSAATSPAAASAPPAVLGGVPAFAQPIYVTRPRIPSPERFHALMGEVFAARWFTNDGAQVRALERALAERLEVPFCTAFCNGTVALQVALRSLDLRGEVITTPFTFPATVHAIEWNGLTPVFCDIDPHTYNLDPLRAAELVTPRTSAILAVHVFGNPCDVAALDELASAHGLRILYDAAHAFGVRHRGRPIGAFGDLSILSFHATKLFHTAEGGAVVGPHAAMATSIALLRNFGIVNENEVRGVGLNGKLSELHAALGRALLDDLDEELAARARLAARYAEGLADIDGLAFQRSAPATEPNHAYCTIEVDPERFGLSRDELHAALLAEQVITRKYFHPLCSENVAYRHLPSADPSRLPNACRVAQRVLCLPLYGELPAPAVDRIVDRIRALRAAAPRVRAALRSV
jgi:dTDP-4-amino-4,6-dideoxygalactose transaminase